MIRRETVVIPVLARMTMTPQTIPKTLGSTNKTRIPVRILRLTLPEGDPQLSAEMWRQWEVSGPPPQTLSMGR